MEYLITILGVVLIVEGIPWFLSPSKIKKLFSQLLILPDRTLRFYGLSMMLAGLLVVYLVRG
jgi:uncharacterized protein YjeT (DUF2065 family)